MKSLPILVTYAFNLILSTLAWAENSGGIVTLAYDPWCPHSCEGSPEGIGVEIAEKSLKIRGHSLKKKVLSWNRAIEDARSGQIDGIIGALKSDAPDFLFPNSTVGIQQTCIYAQKQSAMARETGINKLKGKRLGVISGYAYGEELDQFISQPSKEGPILDYISGVNTTERLVQKLLKNRIDLFAEDKNVTEYYLKKNHEIELNEIYCLASGNLYIALSPKNKVRAMQLIKAIDQGYQELDKRGEIGIIYKKYGVSRLEDGK